MARLSVREYEHIVLSSNGTVLAGVEPPIAKYSVAIGATSTMGQAFNARTKFVRLHADAACSFDIDLLPTAVAGEGSMAAGQTEYFGVQPGEANRVAVITE